MESFRWISVAFSMILGLGVTRVLSGSILVFRSRHRAELDWVPFAWAMAIFVLQLQFWWAMIELAEVERRWSRLDFLNVIAIPLSLYAAAALVLPHQELEAGERLRDGFERDGRLGLMCLAGYAVFAFIADRRLFGVSNPSSIDGFLALELLLPLAAVVSRSRRVEIVSTAVYLMIVLWASWDLSPAVY